MKIYQCPKCGIIENDNGRGWRFDRNRPPACWACEVPMKLIQDDAAWPDMPKPETTEDNQK